MTNQFQELDPSHPITHRLFRWKANAYGTTDKRLNLDWLQQRHWVAVPVEGWLASHLHDPVLQRNALAAMTNEGKDRIYTLMLTSVADGPHTPDTTPVTTENAICVYVVNPGLEATLSAAETASISESLWTNESEEFLLLDTTEEHFVVAGREQFVIDFLQGSITQILSNWKRFSDEWSATPDSNRNAKLYYQMICDHYRQACQQTGS